MIEKRRSFTKPTPQYRRGFSDHDILYHASKGKGGRGISADKMKSMAQWLDYNLEIDELHDEIKRVENKMIKDIIENSNVILSTNSCGVTSRSGTYAFIHEIGVFILFLLLIQ